MIQDIKDITSFKWATVTATGPIAIQIDGDPDPLALLPDSLIDPLSLVVGDRVRVELSLRKCVIHGRSAGDPRVAAAGDWGGKAGPYSWVGPYKVNWDKGFGNNASINAETDVNEILIKATGMYDVWACQRGTSASDYITLGLNGDRVTLEGRVQGIFTHDHAAGANNYTTSRYTGLLNAGETITAGSPFTGGGLVYANSSITGSLIVKRIS